MDIVTAVSAGKAGAELVTALAKLAEEARKSKNPNIQNVLEKLRWEALVMVRGLDRSLDDIINDLKGLNVNLDGSFADAEKAISTLNLVGRWRLGRMSRRLWRTATALRELYADIEAVFLCAEANTALASGTQSAERVRKHLNQLMASDAPVGKTIESMREAIGQAIRTLEESK